MWKLFPLVSLRAASRRNCKRLILIILSPPSATSDSETPWIVRPKIGSVDKTCTFNPWCPSSPTVAGKRCQVDYLSLLGKVMVTHGHPQGITGSETEQVWHHHRSFFLQFGCWECRVPNAWLSCVDWGYFLGPSSQVDCPSKCADDMSPRCCCRLADWQD